MIDVKQAVRTAFFQLLNGQLTFGGNPIPVSEGMKIPGNTSPIYVILDGQTSSPKYVFNGWATDETIDIDINFKAGATVAKATLDNIAGQILALLYPDPANTGVYGLPAQPGVQFLNLVVNADRDLSLSLNASNTLGRRILTLKLYVAQT